MGRRFVLFLTLLVITVASTRGGAVVLNGTLRGHVLNSTNSAAIANAVVTFTPAGGTATTDGSGLYSMVLPVGVYSVSVSAPDFVDPSPQVAIVSNGAITTRDFVMDPLALTQASYDATLKAPKCGQPGQSGCDSNTQLVGRASITGGPEPHQPNTINNSCADGTTGLFHLYPSIDRIKVYTVDHGPLAAGKVVKIDIALWGNTAAPAPAFIDLYYASNATTPVWTYLTSVSVFGFAGQNASATYVLPAGGVQAVRANYREGFSTFASVCSGAGATGVDDHDDLIFKVGSTSTAGDVDGDGKSDLTLFRPSTGTWLIGRSNLGFAGGSGYSWGVSTDLPVPADYDGDGVTDLAIYRPAEGGWHILLSTTFFTAALHLNWGLSTAEPAPGDYDGDGKADPAVFDAQTGVFYVLKSSTNYLAGTVFTVPAHTPGDIPAPGDYDGDGVTDFAVYRPLNASFSVTTSTSNFLITSLTAVGTGGDTPVPGDYDGDGLTDMATYRSSNGTWSVRRSSTSSIVTSVWGVRGDVPVPGDYDGDGKTDQAVFRPSSNTWFVFLSNTGVGVGYGWGATGDIATPNYVLTSVVARNALALATLARNSDFDGDGRSDITVITSGLQWNSLFSGPTQNFTNTNSLGSLVCGAGSTLPAPGDYDGDGVTDVGVFCPSLPLVGFTRSSGGGTATYAWGTVGDILVPGDYDGDGKTDIAVYRPGSGTWFVLQSSTNFTAGMTPVVWGTGSDVPVPGDYDGDGRTDIAVYRPGNGTWYILKSSTNYTAALTPVVWGGAVGDISVPGDYDGDGKTDIAIYRSSSATWFVLKSSSNFTAGMAPVVWGAAGDVPVPGEFDGDAKTDLAVWRPSNGTWFILKSTTNNTAAMSFVLGASADTPILKRQ